MYNCLGDSKGLKLPIPLRHSFGECTADTSTKASFVYRMSTFTGEE